jgi:hypothetical protein
MINLFSIEKKFLLTRYEVLIAVMFVVWVVTDCGLIGRYRRFGGT